MLADPITRRALLEVLILGAALGPLGVWVLLHRQTYAAESRGHRGRAGGGGGACSPRSPARR